MPEGHSKQSKMGTSKCYSASIQGQPQWGQLSSAVTASCGHGAISSAKLSNIVSRYVGVIGGSNKAGRGNSKAGGRAGVRTAKNLGRFFAAFSSSGGSISAALGQIGITGLEGKSVNDVLNQLIEHCSGPAATIDDVAAKAASQKLIEEIADDAETLEELETKLQETLTKDSLEDILIKYFGYYILEHLSIMFYEKLVVEKNKSACDDLFRQIRDYIFEKLTTHNRTNPLKNIDWKGADSDRLIKNIQEDVLKVFEGYES